MYFYEEKKRNSFFFNLLYVLTGWGWGAGLYLKMLTSCEVQPSSAPLPSRPRLQLSDLLVITLSSYQA